MGQNHLCLLGERDPLRCEGPFLRYRGGICSLLSSGLLGVERGTEGLRSSKTVAPVHTPHPKTLQLDAQVLICISNAAGIYFTLNGDKIMCVNMYRMCVCGGYFMLSVYFYTFQLFSCWSGTGSFITSEQQSTKLFPKRFNYSPKALEFFGKIEEKPQKKYDARKTKENSKIKNNFLIFGIRGLCQHQHLLFTAQRAVNRL